MANQADFSNEEWIFCQTFASFIIKLAVQFGDDPTTQLKLANAALREKGLAAQTQFARDFLLWEPTAQEEKARSALLAARDYEHVVNRSLDIFRQKLSDAEFDEIRRILYYISENVSRIGLRNAPDFHEKMKRALALFDEILAFGIDDVNKIKQAVLFIQSGR